MFDDTEIDPVTGKLRTVELQQNSIIQTTLNRKLLYTKAEVDAKIAAGGGGGGTLPTTTKGDLAGYSTVSARVAVGTDGQVLSADSTQALGVKWSTIAGTGDMTKAVYDAANKSAQVLATSDIDIDSTMAANSDVKVASQKAVKTALALKAPIASPTFTGVVTIPTGGSIIAPTGLVKGDVGLGNVDNTSDVTKNAATVALTNKDLTSGTNTFPTLNQNTSGTAANLSGTPALPNGVTATTQAPSDNSTKLATTAYTDLAVSAAVQGLSIKPSAKLGTTAALAANTYNNGASGVGATLTGVATGVLTIDGTAVALNDYILVKDEVAGANNGLYKCTLAGAIGVAYILTRDVNMDTSTEFQGAFVFVEGGTVNASAGFVCTATASITVGTTAVVFQQFSGAGEITVTTPLTKTGNSLGVVNQGTTTQVLHGNAAGNASFSAVVEADITLANNTTNDVTSTKHGYAPISPGDATLFLNGAATPAYTSPRILPVTAKTTTYTATTADGVITVTAAAPWTLTLFTAVGNAGRVLRIKRTDASNTTNFVTVDPNASETIDGNLTYAMYTQYETLTIVSDGTNWQIL
jgi:hypothetical protein